jgi:hypothetical protein
MRFVIFTLHLRYYRNEIKEDELDGACSSYGGDRKCLQNFSAEPEGREYLGDLGVDGKISLN